MKSFSYKILLFLISTLFLSGCPGVVPGSRIYAPKKGSYEETLFSEAKRDVFPDDVRKNLEKHKEKTVVWTGIILASHLEESSIVTEYEHHYWDFVEDYSIQRQIAFVSPRGEGLFGCERKREFFEDFTEQDLPKVGDFAIVYAKPVKVDPDGKILCRCAPFIKTLPPKKYATDVDDYGRDYLLHGDKSDFRHLRTPIFK